VGKETSNHRWAWLVTGLFVAGAVLAVLWMMAEVKRMQQFRDLNNPPRATTPVR